MNIPASASRFNQTSLRSYTVHFAGKADKRPILSQSQYLGMLRNISDTLYGGELPKIVTLKFIRAVFIEGKDPLVKEALPALTDVLKAQADPAEGKRQQLARWKQQLIAIMPDQAQHQLTAQEWRTFLNALGARRNSKAPEYTRIKLGEKLGQQPAFLMITLHKIE